MTTRRPIKRKSKPKALAPRSQRPDPEYSAARTIYVTSSAGVRVNETNALSQSAVWACVRVISETLAGMYWGIGEVLANRTIDPLPEHKLNYLLNEEANPDTRAFFFRETMWAWSCVFGNGYAEIERDLLGNVVNLWQLHPERVTPDRNDRGELVWKVWNPAGVDPTILADRDMFHLMGPSPDGIVGWPVIRMHARSIGLAIAQEQNAASFNENDSTPGGILKHPSRLSDTARNNLKESWDRRHRGPSNRRTMAILEEGMAWEQTSIPPEQAQLVEQMQLTPLAIARIFGVPPHLIAAAIPGSSGTYNNVENQERNFVNHTLKPQAARGESEADIKLFGRNNRGVIVTFFDFSELEKGDTAAQTAHVKDMFDRGMYSVNDGLRYMGKPGIGPEGDKRFVPLNMQLLEIAGEQPPAPTTPPADQPPQDQPADNNQLTILQTGCLAWLTEACGRMLKREKGQREQMGELSAEWLTKHREYCRGILMPPAAFMSQCFGANGASTDVGVSLFLDKHFEKLLDREPNEAALDLRAYLLAAAAAKGAE